MSEVTGARCPVCAALVSVDAEWCGQCFTGLRARRPEAPAPEAQPPEAPVVASVPSVAAGPEEGAEVRRLRVPGPGDSLQPGGSSGRRSTVDHPALGVPTWECPACGEHNRLSSDVCVVCGTSFKRLFQEPERVVDLDPRSALVSSLMFPGLGHVRMGKTADGVARMVLFAWTLATALLLFMSRSGGGGPLGGVAVLFLLSAVAVYALSGADASRVAQGEPPVLSTRILLYGSAGLVLLAMLALGLVVMRVSGS